MTDHDSLADRGRALENEYFRKKDLELVEKIRQAAAAEQSRDAMSRQTGLGDPVLVQELLDMGFTPETVVLLPLVPVLEVAWAEGGVTAAERRLILELARSRGIPEGSPAGDQLELWMKTRPAATVFQHAGRLIAAMLDSQGGDAQSLTADELVAYCEKIAAVSGGVFGLGIFGTVSVEEKLLMKRITEELKTRAR
jgi:hypothetical protein